MYWIYLVLFILIIFTPEVVTRGLYFLGEEDVESLLIFCFGMLGLLLYLGKESALLRVVREKIFLQRETNQIRKDLSQSYSYIGEMNRRFDIVKNSLTALPSAAQQVFGSQKGELYFPIFDALTLLAKSDSVALLFIDEKTGEATENHLLGEGFPETLLDGKHLLGAKKYFWEEDHYYIVRSAENAFDTSCFLLFKKNANRTEDVEVLQILAAEALFLFSIDRKRLEIQTPSALPQSSSYANRN
jgi:hypothetical protein